MARYVELSGLSLPVVEVATVWMRKSTPAESVECDEHIAREPGPAAVRPLVLICGAVAFPGRPAPGGFQSQNLRVGAVLGRLGYNVSYLRYPSVSGMPLRTRLTAYASSFARICVELAFGRRPAVVHFTPYTRRFLAAEAIMIACAHLRGARIIVDLRAGGKERIYRQSPRLYRALLRWTLALASAVSMESNSYQTFVREACPGVKMFYLPIFVPASMVTRPRSAPPRRPPRLIYVGTLSDAKGVLHAIAVTAHLRQLLPGARLVLVGAGPASQAAAASGCDSFVELVGTLRFEDIVPQLDQADFFIFLTLWAGEGHSVALTEAMARGCVPICTRHGFNAEVVGDGGIVVEDRNDTRRVAAAIAETWHSGRYEILSRRCIDRAAAKFTDAAAADVLRAMYGFVLA